MVRTLFEGDIGSLAAQNLVDYMSTDFMLAIISTNRCECSELFPVIDPPVRIDLESSVEYSSSAVFLSPAFTLSQTRAMP